VRTWETNRDELNVCERRREHATQVGPGPSESRKKNRGERYAITRGSTLALGREEIKGREQGEEEHIAQVKKNEVSRDKRNRLGIDMRCGIHNGKGRLIRPPLFLFTSTRPGVSVLYRRFFDIHRNNAHISHQHSVRVDDNIVLGMGQRGT